MTMVWIAAAILLTMFLGILTIGYILTVIGMWCQKFIEKRNGKRNA